MTAIAIAQRDQILQRVQAGERISDIAASLGYASHAGIAMRLAADPEYVAAREIGAEARLETRERELERANEGVTVARARELLGHQRWRCEREFPARWGRAAEVQIVNISTGQALGEDVGALMSQIRGRVGRDRPLEHDAEQQIEGEIAPTV